MKSSLSIWQVLSLPLLVLPSLYLLWAWPALPARIPSHFGIGSIGTYTSRDNIWWLTSALPVATYLFLVTLPRFAPAPMAGRRQPQPAQAYAAARGGD